MKSPAPLAIAQLSALAATSAAPFFQIGNRTGVRPPSGSAAAMFGLERYDRRPKVAGYALKTLNESAVPLTCRVWACRHAVRRRSRIRCRWRSPRFPLSPAASAAAGSNGTFQVETPSVRSGGTIKVRIVAPRNGMHVALTDTQSRQISNVAVGINQHIVPIRAPAVRLAARYVVVASYSDGFGQETAVAPVTIFPLH